MGRGIISKRATRFIAIYGPYPYVHLALKSGGRTATIASTGALHQKRISTAVNQGDFDELTLLGRVLAFALGSICFYVAFFLYEDEEGRLQNRIEELWIAIYQRAKETDVLSTALFNRIAQLCVRFLNWLFGDKLFSLRMAFASMTFSFLSWHLLDNVTTEYFDKDLAWSQEDIGKIILTGLFYLCFIWLTKRRTRLRLTLAWSCIIGSVIINAFDLTIIYAPAFAGLLTKYAIEEVLAILISLASDILAVYVIRRIMGYLAVSATIGKISLALGGLACVFMVVCVAPYMAANDFSLYQSFDPFNRFILWVQAVAADTVLLNYSTGAICIIPALILIVVLLDRLMWPVLSRLLSPITRFKVLLNRKVMASVGSLAWIFAFNLEHVGFKEVLGLLGK